MAQKVLLDLERQLVKTRAAHARAWARVVEMAGRPVAAKIADPTIANPTGEQTR
jgi:NAD-dependent oxidoreductase involved in siderophore biosynthesis